MFMFW